jgi:hypothetical protein
VWPDNTLSDTARQYANEWEQNELPMVRPKVDRL